MRPLKPSLILSPLLALFLGAVPTAQGDPVNVELGVSITFALEKQAGSNDEIYQTATGRLVLTPELQRLLVDHAIACRYSSPSKKIHAEATIGTSREGAGAELYVFDSNGLSNDASFNAEDHGRLHGRATFSTAPGSGADAVTIIVSPLDRFQTGVFGTPNPLPEINIVRIPDDSPDPEERAGGAARESVIFNNETLACELYAVD